MAGLFLAIFVTQSLPNAPDLGIGISSEILWVDETNVKMTKELWMP